MENKDQQAFPYYSGDETKDIPGLTKREYFAGLAMQALLASGVKYIVPREENLVKEAIIHADELLKQLSAT